MQAMFKGSCIWRNFQCIVGPHCHQVDFVLACDLFFFPLGKVVSGEKFAEISQFIEEPVRNIISLKTVIDVKKCDSIGDIDR